MKSIQENRTYDQLSYREKLKIEFQKNSMIYKFYKFLKKVNKKKLKGGKKNNE